MAAAELYKFLLRPCLPGGALARASSGSRATRGAPSAYLGRRQEVGPEAGSGRLEREHGAAACAPRPYGRPDASQFSAPGAAAQAGSAARPAGRTDGRGRTRPSARPRWAEPGGATPIPGSGARSCSQSSQSLGPAMSQSATLEWGATEPREAILRTRFYGGSQGSRLLSQAYCDSRGSCWPREAAMACGRQCAL